jgi:hypothetical protein
MPRPRPHGPADLSILAEDLDRLAAVHTGSAAPKLETGPNAYGRFDTSDSPSADFDSNAATEPDAAAGPVFVDASGRRRKVARRAGLVALAAVAGYAGLLGMSFAGGPIPPNVLLPVPGMPSEKAPASSSIAQDGAVTTPASSGAAEHPTATGRSIKPASGGRPESRSTTTAAAPGAATSSAPPATSAAAPPPTPTPTSTGTSATTSANSHGNPTPPGHQHRSSAPSPTG